MWSIFIFHLYLFFAHFLIGLFVFLLLSFKSSFCILDNSPLLDMCQYVACLFILVSFAEQKILILMKSSSLILYFVEHTFDLFIKSFPNSRFRPSSMLSSRSSIVLHFSVIHFELIFVKGVKSVSTVYFPFARGHPVVPDQLFEMPVFSIAFASTEVLLTTLLQVYFQALHSVPVIPLPILRPIPCYLNDCSSINKS
jgi:hypothetical protein